MAGTTISSDTRYLPFICRALQYVPTALAQCIMCVDAQTGYPVAGVVYDNFNGATIHAHIWVDAERKPSRAWMAAIFDYPFNRLGVGKIIGQVNSFNYEAIKLDEHFGFVKEAEVKEYFDTGASLIVYSMKKHQCRVLNSKRWSKTVELVARAV